MEFGNGLPGTMRRKYFAWCQQTNVDGRLEQFIMNLFRKEGHPLFLF
jgi:hypothetical protein